MTERKWTYQPIDPNGGAGGTVYHQVFNGSGFEAAELLAREAIQNSVDATAQDGNGVKVVFRKKELTGADKEAFWKAAGLGEMASRVDKLNLPDGNVLAAQTSPISVLYAQDSQTTGLRGDPTYPSSNLRKLLMEIGGSPKTDAEEKSGGSYGFGKAVWSASSRIATIFAYSRTTDEEGEPLSVLMGCSYHDAHEFQTEGTSGRGFFAKSTPLENRPDRYDPYVGEEAERLAEALSMERAEGDIGTTIAIVDCDLEIADLRRGVENWWWPRLLTKMLRVELYDNEGERHFPRPIRQPGIKPYWEAMDNLIKKIPDRPGSWKSKKFKAVEGMEVGSIGLLVTDTKIDEDRDDDEEPETNSIAMIRSPGMVVWHHTKQRYGLPPVAAVFLAAEDVDGILRASEPPEHDRWDPKAGRLKTDGEKEVVRSILRRTWTDFKAFQKSAQPKKPSESGRVSEAERLLGKILGPSTKRPGGPDGPGETPVSLVPRISVRPDGDALIAKGSVTITLKPDATAQDVDVSLELRAVDEGGSVKDAIRLHILDRDDFEWNGKALRARLSLPPGEKVELHLESDRYAPDWKLVFQPVIQPAAASEGSS